MAGLKLTLAAAAILGLAGCNQTHTAGGGAGANGICKPFTSAQAQPAAPTATNVLPAAPVGDPSASLDDCLHRWGYTLAASTDPANVVAEATLAACSNALADWNRQAMSSGNAGGAVQAPSLMTGEPTNPMAEHHAYAEARALFYVVQARAGHCSPPPLNAGQPARS